MPNTSLNSAISIHEEYVLERNLIWLNAVLNSKLCYLKVKRKASLFNVKSDQGRYDDLMSAYNDLTEGLGLLLNDTTTAYNKIKASAKIWEKALLEFDPADKKTRIDKDIAIAIYFNLLEAYYALNSPELGGKVLERLKGMELSRKQSAIKQDLEMAFRQLEYIKKPNQ